MLFPSCSGIQQNFPPNGVFNHPILLCAIKIFHCRWRRWNWLRKEHKWGTFLVLWIKKPDCGPLLMQIKLSVTLPSSMSQTRFLVLPNAHRSLGPQEAVIRRYSRSRILHGDQWRGMLPLARLQHYNAVALPPVQESNLSALTKSRPLALVKSYAATFKILSGSAAPREGRDEYQEVGKK